MRIDLRSDTVTQPTPAMRRAMYEAEVGDDVYGEDPTVNRLEALAAEMVGKEAALFLSSGTQGNVCAMLTHCGRGDEIILGDQAHTFLSEAGAPAVLGGITPRPVRNQPDGTLDLADVEAAIRPENVHFPTTRLITVENTHNQCGGMVLPLSYMSQLGALARRHGLKTHLDGARPYPYYQYADDAAGCRFGRTIDNQYALMPITFYTRNGYQNGMMGEVDGFYWVSGEGNAAENLVTVGGVQHLVFQNNTKSGNNDYMAMRLE